LAASARGVLASARTAFDVEDDGVVDRAGRGWRRDDGVAGDDGVADIHQRTPNPGRTSPAKKPFEKQRRLTSSGGSPIELDNWKTECEATVVMRQAVEMASVGPKVRRAIALCVVGLAMVVAATVLHARADDAQKELELRGRRYPGTVMSVRYDPKIPDEVRVRYVVDGVEQSSYVYSDGLDKGDPATVLIDREPPHTVGIQGGTQLFGGRYVVALTLFLPGSVVGIFGAWLLVHEWRVRRKQRAAHRASSG
jgi:hypothetical protein